MSETAYYRYLLREIRNHFGRRVWGFKLHGSQFNRGYPDLIFCIDGHFVAIETKLEGNRLTLLQQENLSKIEMAGGFAMVAVYPNHTAQDVIKEIERWLK